jgi:hypothetical protein
MFVRICAAQASSSLGAAGRQMKIRRRLGVSDGVEPLNGPSISTPATPSSTRPS